jgi:hypothetical protein
VPVTLTLLFFPVKVVVYVLGTAILSVTSRTAVPEKVFVLTEALSYFTVTAFL